MTWRPSPLALSLATTSATALVLAVLGHRPELIAFAAPLLGALASGWRRPHATRVDVRAERPTERCFENESVHIRLHATANGPHDQLAMGAMKDSFLSLDDRKESFMASVAEWTVTPTRWGRFLPRVRITVRAAGGLLVAEEVFEPVEIRVYPRPAPLTVAPRPDHLPDRIGVHIGRIRGEGVEFHGIRPYLPGDPLSRINWPVSVRLGRWHVTERLAERSTDVVALIDTYPVSEAARSGVDLAVHGAAEIVQAALRRGDRAGVLALGGVTRWLGPDVGRRQFYRIADAVLDATPDRLSTRPTGGRVPRGALPPGAVVIAFSPLLDARIGLALQDIRHRGHAIIVVDVLRAVATDDPLVHRMWRLGRRGLHRDLASLGIPVLPWDEESTLDSTLYPVARRPIRTGRPR